MKNLLASLVVFLLPLEAMAQTPAPTSGGQAGKVIKLDNPIHVNSVPELIASLLKAAIGIVGALALLAFIWGGFLWLTSRGEADKVKAGKDAMKWATIGLVVIFASYALVRFVFSAFTG